MAHINPYLTFKDQCEEAFNFYRSVFGGEFLFLGRFSEMPSEFPIEDSEKDKIMHVSLPIGKHTVLMGSDSMREIKDSLQMGNNFSVSIHAETEEEARTLFDALSESGKITFPLQPTFWGSLYGNLVDKFGIQWMINYAMDQKEPI